MYNLSAMNKLQGGESTHLTLLKPVIFLYSYLIPLIGDLRDAWSWVCKKASGLDIQLQLKWFRCPRPTDRPIGLYSSWSYECLIPLVRELELVCKTARGLDILRQLKSFRVLFREARWMPRLFVLCRFTATVHVQRFHICELSQSKIFWQCNLLHDLV